MELMKVLVDNLVGIEAGGCGKLSIHPKLDIDEEGSAEVSIGAIDDGLMGQCVGFKTVGGVCWSFYSTGRISAHCMYMIE